MTEKTENQTHCRKEECEEDGVIPSPNTVVDPLTMVVAAVHAIVALLTESNHTRRIVHQFDTCSHQANAARTILQ